MGGWREGGRVEGGWEGGGKVGGRRKNLLKYTNKTNVYGVSTVPVAFASSEIGSHLKGDNKRHHGGQQCKMET